MFFKNCGTKTKKVKLEVNLPKEVKIKIGVLILKDGKLSLKRGATLPLTVAPLLDLKSCWQKLLKNMLHLTNNCSNGIKFTDFSMQIIKK